MTRGDGFRAPEREAEARALAEERARLRAGGDYPAADALRDRIAALGFAVADTGGAFTLSPLPAPRAAPDLVRPEEVPPVLDAPPTRDATVHWLDEGWPQDVLRGIASFRTHHPERDVQHVVVSATGEEPPVTWPDGTEVVRLVPGQGWARARNAGLLRSAGRIVIVADGSVEAAGDVIGPLADALADPRIGIAGPVAAVTDERLHEFLPAEGTESDAIEAYLMAFRREVLERGVAFDPKFRFYRSADLDFSFRVKALGLRAVRVDVPIVRHEHRAWFNTDPAERARRSKANYYRFLDRWRGRSDLTVSGQSS